VYQFVPWEMPRPKYMKEIEPGSCYWPSETANVRPAEFDAAKLNRELFESRKIDSQSFKRRAAEIVLGKGA